MSENKVAIISLCLFLLSFDAVAVVNPLVKANSERGNVQAITWNCVRRLEAVTSWRYIQSNGYPRLLNVKKSRCSWKIVTESTNRIRLAFRGLDLHTDDPKHCGSNYVEIIDETLKQSQARFCGKKIPDDIVTQGNKVRIDFQAQPGIATNSKGFRIAYSKTKDAPGFYSFQSFGPQKFYSPNQQERIFNKSASKASASSMKNSKNSSERSHSFWATLAGGLIASVAVTLIACLLWKRRKDFKTLKVQLKENKHLKTNSTSSWSNDFAKQQNLPLQKVNNLSLFGKKQVKSSTKINNRSLKNKNKVKQSNQSKSNNTRANLSQNRFGLSKNCIPTKIEVSKKQKTSNLCLKKESSFRGSSSNDFRSDIVSNTFPPKIIPSDNLKPPPLPPKTLPKSRRFENDDLRKKKNFSCPTCCNEIAVSRRIVDNQSFSRSRGHWNSFKTTSTNSRRHRRSKSAFEYPQRCFYNDTFVQESDHFPANNTLLAREDQFSRINEIRQSRKFADAMKTNNQIYLKDNHIQTNSNVQENEKHRTRKNLEQSESIFDSFQANLNYDDKTNFSQFEDLYRKRNQPHHHPDDPPPLPIKLKRLGMSKNNEMF